MKILYKDIARCIKSNPSIEEVSEKLFQLGHENTIEKNSILDIEFTPNRGDCLSLHGIVRDLNVFYKTTLAWGDNLIAAFHEKLNSRKDRELVLGSTQYGPHKDDLDLILKGHTLREYGSQGQHRSASLALKLGAAKQLQVAFKKPPIYLLDDVFAELDLRRREALGELIQGGAQTFIASPHPEDIPFSLDQQINLSIA